MLKTVLFVVLSLAFFITASPVVAQQTSESDLAKQTSDSDLAKQAQNPIANMISLPLQNNTNFGIGPNNETNNILNVQPVIPFSITDNVNLITRTIVPFISQPQILTRDDDDRITGMGDITFSAFFSSKGSGKLTWGAGPVFLFPSATDSALGANKWGTGPSVVLLTMPGNWVIGSLFSNIWSFAGSGNDGINVFPEGSSWSDKANKDVTLFTWQYFIYYNLPKGWYLPSAPISTATGRKTAATDGRFPSAGGSGSYSKSESNPSMLRSRHSITLRNRKTGLTGNCACSCSFFFRNEGKGPGSV
jgi:hypothetical protein